MSSKSLENFKYVRCRNMYYILYIIMHYNIRDIRNVILYVIICIKILILLHYDNDNYIIIVATDVSKFSFNKRNSK